MHDWTSNSSTFMLHKQQLAASGSTKQRSLRDLCREKCASQLRVCVSFKGGGCEVGLHHVTISMTALGGIWLLWEQVDSFRKPRLLTYLLNFWFILMYDASSEEGTRSWTRYSWRFYSTAYSTYKVSILRLKIKIYFTETETPKSWNEDKLTEKQYLPFLGFLLSRTSSWGCWGGCWASRTRALQLPMPPLPPAPLNLCWASPPCPSCPGWSLWLLCEPGSLYPGPVRVL